MDYDFIAHIINGSLYEYLLENSIYPDEDFKRAEAEAINRMSVPKKITFMTIIKI